MQQLNQRQQQILNFFSKKEFLSNSEIIAFLGNNVSRYTVLRDIKYLLKEKIIKKQGKGRLVNYSLLEQNSLFVFINPETYFKTPMDERILKYSSFNEHIFDNLNNLFSKQELHKFNELNNKYLERIKNSSEAILKKETERLIIELSWKSSQMEGNTYSLFDAELLIKERIEASGHSKEEAIMILNHKNAIDYILQNKKDFKKIDLFQIEKIHELLTRGMKVKPGLRTGPVGIIGTKYLPMDNQDKIRIALFKTIDLINSTKDAFSKALLAILMISYIQPFEDGNKRTSRILGNALLLANNICPISYRSINESSYKKAIVIFYEQNSIRLIKELFINQFEFAVKNYLVK